MQEHTWFAYGDIRMQVSGSMLLRGHISGVQGMHVGTASKHTMSYLALRLTSTLVTVLAGHGRCTTCPITLHSYFNENGLFYRTPEMMTPVSGHFRMVSSVCIEGFHQCTCKKGKYTHTCNELFKYTYSKMVNCNSTLDCSLVEFTAFLGWSSCSS